MIKLPYWIRVGRDSRIPCQNCEKPGCWFKCLENDNYTQEQINHANIYTYNVLQQEINRKVRYF